MEKLNQYFKLQKEIYSYFNYVEDWKVIPLEDSCEFYWKLNQNGDGGGNVHFAKTKEKLNNICAGELYRNEIYTQRFLSKWIYRGKDYTMICVDTHSDGNKFLQIFSNDKEIKGRY